MGKGGSEKSPLADPTTPIATAPKNTGTPSTDVLKTMTFHEFYKSKTKNERVGLQEAIVAGVNIPLGEWNSLTLSDRATRTANYIQYKTEICANANLIGDTVEEGKERLDEVNWTPYITEETMSSAAKGDKPSLKKVETIRRMYECTFGIAEDDKNIYTPQIKENLLSSFYVRPEVDTVNRADYFTADGHSMLNTDTLETYGGSVTNSPAEGTNFPFDGLYINAPSATWKRAPMLNPPLMLVFPVKTVDGKYVPSFAYSS